MFCPYKKCLTLSAVVSATVIPICTYVSATPRAVKLCVGTGAIMATILGTYYLFISQSSIKTLPSVQNITDVNYSVPENTLVSNNESSAHEDQILSGEVAG